MSSDWRWNRQFPVWETDDFCFLYWKEVQPILLRTNYGVDWLRDIDCEDFPIIKIKISDYSIIYYIDELENKLINDPITKIKFRFQKEYFQNILRLKFGKLLVGEVARIKTLYIS